MNNNHSVKKYIIGGTVWRHGQKLDKKHKPAYFKNNALFLEVSEVSELICLDFDIDISTLTNDEYYKYWIDNVIDFDNDFIIHSNEYTMDDVRNGLCRFKVVYRYKGEGFARNKKNGSNIGIEVFYNKKRNNNRWVKFAGERGKDDYQNIFVNIDNIRKLPISPYTLMEKNNPYLKYKEKFNIATKIDIDPDKMNKVTKTAGYEPVANTTTQTIAKKAKVSNINSKPNNNKSNSKVPVSNINDTDGDIATMECDFRESLTTIGIEVNNLTLTSKGLLTFDCLFNDTLHTSNNHAYAFRGERGNFVCKCHGVVCEDAYAELNKQLEKVTIVPRYETLFNNCVGGVNVLHASTGIGKTEAIAKTISNKLNEEPNQKTNKLLVILQDMGSIQKLIERVSYYTHVYVKILDNSPRIFRFIGNNSKHYREAIHVADVIITHHAYFSLCGSLLAYHDKIDYILDKEPNIIIDEAHSWLNSASNINVSAGGLYEDGLLLNEDIKTKNKKSYTNEQVASNKMNPTTKCIELVANNYNIGEFRRPRALYKNRTYYDLANLVGANMEYNDQTVNGIYKYRTFINDKPDSLLANKNVFNDIRGIVRSLMHTANYCIMTINIGDDIPRKQIGDVSLQFHSDQLVKKILKGKNVILTSATFNKMHFNILDEIGEYNYERVSKKIDKVENIILLKTDKETNNKTHYKREIFEYLNNKKVHSLLYLPKIDDCRQEITRYGNSEMVSNGLYTYHKVNRHDVTHYKYLTFAGLESTMSKGYNYTIEVDKTGDGFDVVYLDNSPVSPDYLRSYMKDGELHFSNGDYSIDTFLQSIGRCFRKNKNTLTIIANNINDVEHGILLDELEKNTTANVISEGYSINNLTTCLTNGDDEHINKDSTLYNKLKYGNSHIVDGINIEYSIDETNNDIEKENNKDDNMDIDRYTKNNKDYYRVSKIVNYYLPFEKNKINPTVLANAVRRGNIIHSTLDGYIRTNKLTLDKNNGIYKKQLINFIDVYKHVTGDLLDVGKVKSEKRILRRIGSVNVGGTVDMIVFNNDGTMSIMDWKTSSGVSSWVSWGLQLTLYKRLAEERYKRKVNGLYLINVNKKNERKLFNFDYEEFDTVVDLILQNNSNNDAQVHILLNEIKNNKLNKYKIKLK